ncbi:hypothetical protein TSAR_006452, partial [Trichomalopsis sarcophagae]
SRTSEDIRRSKGQVLIQPNRDTTQCRQNRAVFSPNFIKLNKTIKTHHVYENGEESNTISLTTSTRTGRKSAQLAALSQKANTDASTWTK